MANLKERFKQGLKTAATKTVNATIGTPEHRQHQADVNFRVNDAKRRGYEQGRIKGAFQEGYRQGKQKSKNNSGTIGLLGAGVQGLNDGLHVASNIIGVDVGQNQRRSQPRKQKKNRHRNHNRESDTFIF